MPGRNAVCRLLLTTISFSGRQGFSWSTMYLRGMAKVVKEHAKLCSSSPAGEVLRMYALARFQVSLLRILLTNMDSFVMNPSILTVGASAVIR